MQSEQDAERIADPGCGDCQSIGGRQPEIRGRRYRSGQKASPVVFGSRQQWLVAGSTHRGEEEILLQVFGFLRTQYPKLSMVLAPRHPERFIEVEKMLERSRFEFARRSRIDHDKSFDKDILLLDSVGELADFFALGDIAFVGGSLVDAGGHNVLEPAKWHKPILFGPFMANFKSIAEQLKRAGAAIEVAGGDELAAALGGLLGDAEKHRQRARRQRKSLWMETTLSYAICNWRSAICDETSCCAENLAYCWRPVFMDMTTDWMRGVWERRGFRNRLLWVGLLPASVVYRVIIHVRNLLFAWGWLKTKRLSRPVVSVGNLTVGGTGKTPTCIWLAQELTKRGLRIGILSRGYKRKNTESMVVSPQPLESLSADSNDEILKAGDEPFMMAQLYGQTVAVGSDRDEAATLLLRNRNVDLFILDDGFQHRRIQRDFDLLLLGNDATGSLLPAGPFRESKSSLLRADGLLLTGSQNGWQALVDGSRACTAFVGSLQPVVLVVLLRIVGKNSR